MYHTPQKIATNCRHVVSLSGNMDEDYRALAMGMTWFIASTHSWNGQDCFCSNFYTTVGKEHIGCNLFPNKRAHTDHLLHAKRINTLDSMQVYMNDWCCASCARCGRNALYRTSDTCHLFSWTYSILSQHFARSWTKGQNVNFPVGAIFSQLLIFTLLVQEPCRPMKVYICARQR